MRMHIEEIRKFCLALQHTTEDVQWGSDLLFRVGGKIYTSVNLGETGANHLCFKCSPEDFAALVERQGVIPAPYVARYHWVCLERLDALSGEELRSRIAGSYEMVLARLPKRVRDGLATKKNARPERAAPRRAGRKRH
jgi:predicted DNA-binding protein (MmcQ/YjbR family)